MIGSIFVSFVAVFVVTTAVFFVANNKMKKHAAEHTSANYVMDVQHNRMNTQYDNLVGNINKNNKKLATYIKGNNSLIDTNRDEIKKQNKNTIKKLNEFDTKNKERMQHLKKETSDAIQSYVQMNEEMAKNVKNVKSTMNKELKKTKSTMGSMMNKKMSDIESGLSSKAEEIMSKSNESMDTIRNELNRFDSSQRQMSDSASELQRRINTINDAVNSDVKENTDRVRAINTNVDAISRGVDAIKVSIDNVKGDIDSDISNLNTRYTDLISKQSQFATMDMMRGLATKDQLNNVKDDINMLTNIARQTETDMNDVKTKALLNDSVIQQNKDKLGEMNGMESRISGMVDRKMNTMDNRFEQLESVDSSHNEKLNKLIQDVEQMKSAGGDGFDIDGGGSNKPGTDNMNVTLFDEEARKSMSHFFNKSDFVDSYLNRGGNTNLFRDWFDDYYNIDKMTKNFTSFENMIQKTDETSSKVPEIETIVKDNETKLEDVQKKITTLENMKKDIETKVDRLESTGNYQSKIDQLDSELETLRTMMTMMSNNNGTGGVSGGNGLKLSEIIAAMTLQQNSNKGNSSPAPVGNVDVSGSIRDFMDTRFDQYLKNSSSEIKDIVEKEDLSLRDVEVDDLDIRGKVKLNGVDVTNKLQAGQIPTNLGNITNRHVKNIRRTTDATGDTLFEFIDNHNNVMETVRIPSVSTSDDSDGDGENIRIEFNNFRQTYDFYVGNRKLESINIPQMRYSGSQRDRNIYNFGSGTSSFDVEVPIKYVKDIEYDTTNNRYVATKVDDNVESRVEISSGSAGTGEGGVADINVVDGRIVAQRINEQDGFNDGIRLGNICLRSNNMNPPKLMMCDDDCTNNCTDIWDYRTAPHPTMRP